MLKKKQKFLNRELIPLVTENQFQYVQHAKTTLTLTYASELNKTAYSKMTFSKRSS